MPTNDTPATATVITTLPFTVTEDPTGGADSTYTPSCGGVKTPLWYVYTPPAGVTAVGFEFDTVDPGADYEPILSCWFGAVPSLTQWIDQCFTWSNPSKGQINVTPGEAIYFQITDDGAGPPGTSLIFSVLAAPDEAQVVGDLFVSNDTSNFPAALISASGDLKAIIGFAAFEMADTLPDGTICANTENTQVTGDDRVYAVTIYNPDLSVRFQSTSLVVDPQTAISPVRSDRNATFYVSRVDQTFPVVTRTSIITVNSMGVQGPTTWTLPSNADAMSAMAPLRDGSILFYGVSTSGTSTIFQYDLVNSAALPNLVASLGGTSAIGRDMFVLADGTLLVVLRLDNTNTGWRVRRYNSSTGVVLNTYVVGTSIGSSPRIDLGLDDPDSFWLMSFPDGDHTQFRQIEIATGTELVDFTLEQQDATDTTGPMFGPSQSCPLIVLLSSTPEPPDLEATEYDIRWLIRAPHVSSAGRRVFHQMLQLDMQTGQGNVDGSEPVVLLRSSNDGGFTWSSYRQANVGLRGVYGRRVYWHQLGASRDRVYEVSGVGRGASGAIIQAWLAAEEGTS